MPSWIPSVTTTAESPITMQKEGVTYAKQYEPSSGTYRYYRPPTYIEQSLEEMMPKEYPASASIRGGFGGGAGGANTSWGALQGGTPGTTQAARTPEGGVSVGYHGSGDKPWIKTGPEYEPGVWGHGSFGPAAKPDLSNGAKAGDFLRYVEGMGYDISKWRTHEGQMQLVEQYNRAGGNFDTESFLRSLPLKAAPPTATPPPVAPPRTVATPRGTVAPGAVSSQAKGTDTLSSVIQGLKGALGLTGAKAAPLPATASTSTFPTFQQYLTSATAPPSVISDILQEIGRGWGGDIRQIPEMIRRGLGAGISTIGEQIGWPGKAEGGLGISGRLYSGDPSTYVEPIFGRPSDALANLYLNSIEQPTQDYSQAMSRPGQSTRFGEPILQGPEAGKIQPYESGRTSAKTQEVLSQLPQTQVKQAINLWNTGKMTTNDLVSSIAGQTGLDVINKEIDKNQKSGDMEMVQRLANIHQGIQRQIQFNNILQQAIMAISQGMGGGPQAAGVTAARMPMIQQAAGAQLETMPPFAPQIPGQVPGQQVPYLPPELQGLGPQTQQNIPRLRGLEYQPTQEDWSNRVYPGLPQRRIRPAIEFQYPSNQTRLPFIT